jgi:hypothetical protein
MTSCISGSRNQIRALVPKTFLPFEDRWDAPDGQTTSSRDRSCDSQPSWGPDSHLASAGCRYCAGGALVNPASA